MRARVLTLVAVGSAVVIGVCYCLWTPDRSSAELAHKYLNSKSDLLLIDDQVLHVRDSGEGSKPAIIMIHGFGSSLQTWDAWTDALAQDFRVVRFDLPGSGLSPPDVKLDYTDERSLKILAALMDNLNIRRAHIIGNSLGGRLAWKFAAQHPGRVNKLILISPDGFASPGFAYGERPHVPAIAKLMRYVLPRALLRQNLEPSYGDPSRLTEATVDRYYELLLAPGARDAMIARMEQTVLSPPEPWLQKIEAPVLLLWGAKDAMIPIANAADYLRALKLAKLVRFDALGHVPQEEAPDTVLPAVREFLQ